MNVFSLPLRGQFVFGLVQSILTFCTWWVTDKQIKNIQCMNE